jgi:hypothetical protein
MSWTGQCQPCALEALSENISGIALHRGPAFYRWRRAMAASVGAVLVDEPPESG